MIVAALGLVPATAGAARICVAAAGPGCDTTAAGVQAALDAAKASSANDEIVIGEGRFEGPFSYTPFTDTGTLKITGQGAGTVLTAPGPTAGSITVLELGQDAAGHAADISDLAVHVPANTTNGINPGNIGIRAAGTVDGVEVVFDTNDASATAPFGVVLSTSGAVVRNSDIELPATSNFGTGVSSQVPGLAVAPVVADSRILAPIGVASAPGALNVVRSRIVSSIRGVEACNGPVTIEDSLIRVTGSFGVGLEPVGGRCGSTLPSVTARQVTIVGNGAAGQIGVRVVVGVAGQTPVADVSLSIVRDLATAFKAQTVTPGVATIRVGASDFEAARHVETSGAGGTAVFEQTQPNIDADPLFRDELGGDFSLRSGSPAIDSAFSPPLAPGESSTDIEGNPRVLDGNGDGVAARDMGAFESPAVPPPPVAGPPPPAVDRIPPDTKISRGPKSMLKVKGNRRAAVSFSFQSTEAGSTFQCQLDRGAFGVCRSPTKELLKVGSHLFRVRAVDAAGNVDPTPATESIRVVRAKAHHRPHRHH